MEVAPSTGKAEAKRKNHSSEQKDKKRKEGKGATGARCTSVQDSIIGEGREKNSSKERRRGTEKGAPVGGKQSWPKGEDPTHKGKPQKEALERAFKLLHGREGTPEKVKMTGGNQTRKEKKPGVNTLGGRF